VLQYVGVFMMKKRTTYLIILAWFQSITFNIAHPITPSFVKYLDIPERMFGVFFSMMSLGIVIASPFWGILADRGKPMIYMLFGAFLYALGQFGFGYSEDVFVMTLSRFVSGIGASSLLTITAALIVQQENINVGKALSWLGAFIILGSSMGYYIGGFASTFKETLQTDTFQYVFFIQIVLVAVYGGLVWLITKPMSSVHLSKKNNIIDDMRNMIRIPFHQLLFFLSLSFATMSYIYMSKYLDVYFNTLGFNPNILGEFVLISGAVSVLFTLLVIPKIISSKPIFWISTFFMMSVTSLLIVFRLPDFLLSMYTIYMFFIIAKASYQPFEQNYIATFESLPYGALMGIRQLFVGLGMVLGPIFLGFIYDFNSILSFDIAALMILISLVLTLISHFLKNKYKKTIKTPF
jgi:DHA1 family multidrug resistance protein-like MFS transporter